MSTSNGVPVFHSLGGGTVEQSKKTSLKLLANRVLSKDASVPPHPATWNTQWNSVPNFDQHFYAELYHERAGIYQYEGGFSQYESERFAYRDVMAEIMEAHFPELVAQFAIAVATINTTKH